MNSHHGRIDQQLDAALTLEINMPETAPRTALQHCPQPKQAHNAGTCCLPPGRAIGLQLRHSSQVVIVQGSAWVTLGKPLHHFARSDGDHFLQTGQCIDLPAGARLVIEPHQRDQSVQFEWRAMPPQAKPGASQGTSWGRWSKWLGALWRAGAPAGCASA